MKSDKEQLDSRGFLGDVDYSQYNDLVTTDILNLLNSKDPKERTLAARLLKEKPNSDITVDILIKALSIENKIYPKIEISELLAQLGEIAVLPLIEQLGKIGDNQHKEISAKEFNKKSYPLPRDIAARILGQMGKPALPELMKLIQTDGEIDAVDTAKVSEAIDAIGFICYNDRNSEVFPIIQECIQNNKENKLIRWKLFRACSAFPESIAFLKIKSNQEENLDIIREMNRSMKIINKDFPPEEDDALKVS